MDISHADIYLDYLKIRQTLFNKLFLLSFMIYPKTQHSRREIKDFLYVASKNPNKPTNRQLTHPRKKETKHQNLACVFLVYSHFFKYWHILIELQEYRIPVKNNLYRKYGNIV